MSPTVMSFEFGARSVLPLLFLAVFLCSVTFGRDESDSDDLLVRLPHGGSLKGTALKTLRGREIRSFLSVPYARPPLGDLRFKAPLPAESWSGVLDATRDAPVCTQRNPYVREQRVSGQEDCLYLSVHAPRLPLLPSASEYEDKAAEQGKSEWSNVVDVDDVDDVGPGGGGGVDVPPPLPVMVFLHGGGFMCGAGISSFYGPQHLLDRDVVLVGVNYRLGPLGFLSTGDLNCPGNNGLKDQSLALRWIRDNIASFGGDPQLVTLFGESAGGAGVDYHMISDMSKGLFQRAISQSGTALCPWAAPPAPGEPERRARRLAELLDCPLQQEEQDPWPRSLDCLRRKSAESVTDAFYQFYEWDTDPMIAFPPVVEPAHEGAFLADHPRVLMDPDKRMVAGDVVWGATVPWITGVTRDEGALKTAALFGMPHLAQELDSDWSRVAPILLQYKGAPAERELSRRIREYYLPGGARICRDTRKNVTDLMSDHWFLSGMHESLGLRLRSLRAARADTRSSSGGGGGDTYAYLFAYRGSASFTRLFGDPTDTDYGVCHADELQYLFPVGKGLFPDTELSDQDKQMVRKLTELWTNFARHGRPYLDNDTDSTRWRPLDHNKMAEDNAPPLDYYVIDSQPGRMESSRTWTERARFWLTLPGAPLSENGVTLNYNAGGSRRRHGNDDVVPDADAPVKDEL